MLNEEQIKQAINRINELQRETIEKADKIEGSKEYVAKQMKLFEEAEEHRRKLNFVIQQQEKLSEEFIKLP